MGNFAVNLPYTEISLRGLKLCRRCCRNRNLLKDGSQKYRYRKLKDDSQNLKDGSRKCRYRKLRDDSQNLKDGSRMFHGLQLRDGSRKRDVTGHGCKRVC